MKISVIKSDGQYKSALDRLEVLVGMDPAADSSEGSELELLSLLVEDYENKKFPIENPDPVEFVKFLMVEQDLRQVDLVPYFGSRSRVSEFLSRQRPLTVQMIRELSKGLGIPTEILVQESTEGKVSSAEADFAWDKLPAKEMLARGWISSEKSKVSKEELAAKARAFVERVLGDAQSPVFARRSVKGEATSSWLNDYALLAWQARVLEKSEAEENKPTTKFNIEKLNTEFFVELIRLSAREQGPLDAIDYLKNAGIAVVIEKHLQKTKLDGAAMLSRKGVPVIGITLRFDRLDYFWFTLVHELVHVWKHLNKPGDAFLDRLEDKESSEAIEKEANRFARDLLIPRAAWKSSNLRAMATKSGILRFANELNISPAIVAGRVRKETGNYAVFSDLVGNGAVGRLFE